MLDGCDRDKLTTESWETIELTTHLPDHFGDFFEHRGPTPCHFDSRRAFHRFYLRQQAVLQHRGSLLGVLTKDVSRRGIGILAPVQLLPKERVELQLADGQKYCLEIARCHRIDVACYECGTRFVLSPDPRTPRRGGYR